MLLRLQKKGNILIINKRILLSLPRLSTQNTIGSYHLWFMLFTTYNEKPATPFISQENFCQMKYLEISRDLTMEVTQLTCIP